jgi:DNA-binding beta-propeller fold protein YncE
VLTDKRLLVRVDPARNAVVASIALPDSEWPENAVAYAHGSVWVTVPSPSTTEQPELDSILRIDPKTNRVVARIHVGHSPNGIAATPDAVWTANHRSDWPRGAPTATGRFEISRVDPVANSETRRITVETRNASDAGDVFCCGPSAMTFAAGALWLTDPQEEGHSGLVVRVDPATGGVVSIPFKGTKTVACGDIAGDDSAVWLTSGCNQWYLSRINPQTNQIDAQVNLGSATRDIELGFGSVWVNAFAGLIRIDPKTTKVVGRTALFSPSGLAIAHGSLWVGVGDRVVRLTPR